MVEIAEGRFPPGGQLPTEPELARRLGVGRTTIREAIQKLRTVGAVEVRKGLGTFVSLDNRSDPILAFAAWSHENRYEVSELFEARLALELTGASLAAQRATAPQVRSLRAAARAHVRAERANELGDLADTDRAFHAAIFELSGNRLLTKLYEMLVPQITEYRHLSLAIPGAPQRSGQDHLAIVDAIASGAPTAARTAMLDHLWTLYLEFADAAEGRRARHAQRVAGREAFQSVPDGTTAVRGA